MREGSDPSQAPADAPQHGRGSASDLSTLRSRLERVRVLARGALLLQRTSWLLAGFLAAAVGGGAFDFILRTPAPIRGMVWLGVALWLTISLRRWIWPAATFKPSLTEVALRVEHVLPGSSGSRLASGLDLAEQLSADPTLGGRPDAAALARAAIDDASHRAGAFGVLTAMRWAGTLRALGVCAAAVALTFTLLAANPRLFTIGAKRVLMPWASAPWPKRTGVVDTTHITAHPIGSALPLRAAVYRTNRPAGRTDVRVAYRVLEGFQAGPITRSLLTSQGRQIPVIPSLAEGNEQGELYERLVEAGSLAISAPTGASSEARQLTLEYWFETDDDQSDRATIILVDPPAVLAAKATLDAPEYARALASRYVTGEHDLGAGREDRGVLGPILAGSRVTLTLELNKPVLGRPEMLGFGASTPVPEGATLTLEGRTWTIAFEADRSVRLPVAMVDEFSIPSAQDAVFAFEVAADAPPTAAILDPAHDESVLPTAIVQADAEGRDDVGLAFVELRTQKAAAPTGSAGAPAAPVGEPLVAARTEAPAPAPVAPGQPDASRRSLASATLTLGDMSLKPGDELWLTAIASDIFALAGKTHEPVASQVRRLRIISESEFVEQISGEMTGLRQAVQRLDDDQKKLQSQPGDKAFNAEAQRGQQQITERLAPTREAIQRLADRIERNGLKDAALRGILQDARSLASAAAERSSEAQAAMERASRAPGEENARAAADAQQRTHEELSRLADALERGKDNWAARRDIEKLLQAQKDLRQQTAQATEQLAGKRDADLTQAEKSALEALAQRQRALADQTAATLDSLTDRAQRLKQADPVQAEAIQSAAQRGRQDRVSDQQQDAADQLEQNRTQQASDQQDQASKTLEKMLDELDQGAKKREQTLRRLLADVTRQLEELIASQKTQIAALENARKSGTFEGLDEPMIRINQDTLGIAQRVRTTFKELAAIGEPLGVAGRAQANAIAGLRAAPADPTKADTGERLSLDKLSEALELARKSEQNSKAQEDAKKLEELRDAYREALSRQALLEQQTAPYIGKEVGRRERAAIRELAERQRSLRDQLEELRTKTSGLKDAAVFDFAHARLNTLTSEAATLLDELTPTIQVARDQAGAKRLLKSLADVLSDARKQKDFRDVEGEEEGGGGGGGGASQKKDNLIPPLAELKLLREMQAELADMTRALADTQDQAELARLGALQTELAGQARDLAERTKEQGQGGPQPAPKPGMKNQDNPPDVQPAGQPPLPPPDAQPQGGADRADRTDPS
jgi:hypothetical protein